MSACVHRWSWPARVERAGDRYLELHHHGKSTSDVDFYSERRLQFSDSLTRTAGSHHHAFFPARIIFPSLDAFRTFTPVVFWWPYLKSAPAYPGIDTSWTNDMPSEQWRSATQWSMSDSSYGFYAFNLLNRTNVKDINTVWGSLDYPNTPPPANLGFGTPRDVFNAYQTQVGARIKF